MEEETDGFFTNSIADSRHTLSYWGGTSDISPAFTTNPCDFIAALATAQSLGVDFLPVSWQPAAAGIGVGGTASVRQSPADAKISFAIKAFKGAEDIERMYPQHQGPHIKRAFQVFINEVAILRHSRLRSHPNIIDIIGICFQVMPGGRVWPAMVLKVTALGDLERFAKSATGRSLSIVSRLQICVDIAITIQHLHSCCMYQPNHCSMGTLTS